MKSEKRVIAVIVEGPSDENAIGGILKEYFSSEEVQFAVVHDFISFISNETLAVPGAYKATWRFIEKEKHSLERHSNMHLIFTK